MREAVAMAVEAGVESTEGGRGNDKEVANKDNITPNSM